MDRFLLFTRTIRYLKWKQVVWRLYLVWARATQRVQPVPLLVCLKPYPLVAPIERAPGWLGDGFRFLNREVRCHSIDWNASDRPKLWLYNLHYFDYLQQPSLDQADGIALILDWVERNPPFQGNGWEPYPISLRIVNWLKFLCRERLDPATEARIAQSLYQQARHLRRTLEYHLLANHLFKNGVALLFAGALMKGGREPEEWSRKGVEILRAEIAEQILPDGGHFERSPMYHAIILEDVLDCLNLLSNANANATVSFGDLPSPQPLSPLGRGALEMGALADLRPSRSHAHPIKPKSENVEVNLRSTAERMLSFLQDIVHPDGSYPRFNDSAEGVAPTLDQLRRYAVRLNIPVPPFSPPEAAPAVIEKADFGLCVLSNGPWRCLVDCGPIGPDYQPGHTHCDTLSFELTLDGVLVAVNAGTYEYAGSERNRFRATRAHNTLELDGQEQHEIWSTFRVARRGYPRQIQVRGGGGLATFSGQHTGYRRLLGRPIHQRTLTLSASGLHVVDQVLSSGRHRAISRVHLHPDVELRGCDETVAELSVAGRRLLMKLESGRLSVGEYDFSREFGLLEPAKVLIVADARSTALRLSYRLEFE
ncbi:alginate lyase family protein [uncultured Thiocystis sp.]|jgi:uncharacterized heparinase superfamily protein|uniref:heparinase II/III family protein n=1 Tax=uncultured Thiocystis sp. TaxID=1202134 RepID=UPI0025DC62A3|nr:alginate lyase family protein [uncultured Thiocystis sp.]